MVVIDDNNPDGVTPVRVINYTNPYDGSPEGDLRLTFDAWVYGVMIVLTIIANIVY